MICWGIPQGTAPSKIGVCCLKVASIRYSLVKGERIVRFVLTTQLRELLRLSAWVYIRGGSALILLRMNLWD